MGIFTIADLHLSFSTDKPMDVFGGKWENYTEKLKTNWNRLIKDEDVVIIPGDLSWAMYLEDTADDFRFLHQLKGQKIIMKGNHDYWFSTASKLHTFLEQNGFTSLRLLHNNFYSYIGDKKYGICGTKGCDVSKKPTKEEDLKLLNREAIRLSNSIEQAKKAGCDEILVFLHYPPVLESDKFNQNPFTEILHQHGIQQCYYGHLHHLAARRAIEGVYDGVAYRLVSCDHLNFEPWQIL